VTLLPPGRLLPTARRHAPSSVNPAKRSESGATEKDDAKRIYNDPCAVAALPASFSGAQGEQMGIYVNVKCGGCSKSLTEGYTADYYAIGSPIIMCEKCGAFNSHADKCTEWSMMSSARKTYFIVRVGLA
jgi:hypothetical protein